VLKTFYCSLEFFKDFVILSFGGFVVPSHALGRRDSLSYQTPISFLRSLFASFYFGYNISTWVFARACDARECHIRGNMQTCIFPLFATLQSASHTNRAVHHSFLRKFYLNLELFSKLNEFQNYNLYLHNDLLESLRSKE
jgi:hypothetical protein